MSLELLTMDSYKDLSDFVKMKHPYWGAVFAPSEDAISEAIIKLKDSTVDQIQSFISTIYKIRKNKNYVTQILNKLPGLSEQSHLSVLMSFDFHIDEMGDAKLIEINTNAAFSLVAYLINEFQNKETLSSVFLEVLKNSFQNDFDLFHGSHREIKKIAIVDKNPQEQKAYFEFLLYKTLFEYWGWESEILDISEFNTTLGFDFVYNRHTDFYLTNTESQNLNLAYKNKTICLSPHPTEYALLADKNRLIDFSDSSFLKNYLSENETKSVINMIPKTIDFATSDLEYLWKHRKNLFFKPKSSFGGKAAYKGESISRKKFDELDSSSFIAQEFAPPGTIKLNSDSFKWDLRCYVYDGEIQMIGARVYKGQVTNFRGPGSGMAAVESRTCPHFLGRSEKKQ